MRPNWALVLCVSINTLLTEVAFTRSGSAIVEGPGATCVGTTTLCPALKVKAQTAEGTRGFPYCGSADLVNRRDGVCQTHEFTNTVTHTQNGTLLTTETQQPPLQTPLSDATKARKVSMATTLSNKTQSPRGFVLTGDKDVHLLIPQHKGYTTTLKRFSVYVSNLNKAVI